MHLFMVLIGCRPKGRNTEQHDVFFGIAHELRDLVPEIKQFWKGASPLHLDGWRIVKNVDGYKISVSGKEHPTIQPFNHSTNQPTPKLFFLNLGGYKENHFEEFHYKMLTVAANKAGAAAAAKKTAFFMHTGFNKDAAAHIDDRFGVDVDDLFEIPDILPAAIKDKFCINIEPGISLPEDEIQLGYFKLHEL